MSHNIHYATWSFKKSNRHALGTAFRVEFVQRITILPLEWGGFRGFFEKFENFKFSIEFITMIIQPHLFHMNGISGFCLKCKIYGPIKDGKMVVMNNGRTRCAGFCSQQGCTGKISKIVS